MKDCGDNESEGAGIGAVASMALGDVGGLLVGLEALIIPGVGPLSRMPRVSVMRSICTLFVLVTCAISVASVVMRSLFVLRMSPTISFHLAEPE